MFSNKSSSELIKVRSPMQTTDLQPPTDNELLELFGLIYRTGDTETPTCIEFARTVLERWGN